MQKRTRVLVFVLVVLMGVAATSQAQQSERRFFTSIDGGYQSGGQRLQGRVTEDVYDESQISDTDYTIERSAALFRANVTARLQPHLGFGFGFTRSVSSGSADLTAAVLMEAEMKSVNMTGALIGGLVEADGLEELL